MEKIFSDLTNEEYDILLKDQILFNENSDALLSSYFNMDAKQLEKHITGIDTLLQNMIKVILVQTKDEEITNNNDITFIEEPIILEDIPEIKIEPEPELSKQIEDIPEVPIVEKIEPIEIIQTKTISDKVVKTRRRVFVEIEED